MKQEQNNTWKQTRVLKAVKKAKDDWIGTLEVIETYLKYNNGKRAYQLVKEETGQVLYYPGLSRWLLHSLKRATYSSARTTELSASPVMLKAILNRLKPQAEGLFAEEQNAVRAWTSTTEPIFNLRILCEIYLQHQQNLYHDFIDL